ncbi:LysR substrate-binding domain-containing protein [Paenibacillus sp. M1]|uniref:LysR substrate-binding domain-containing protein n=1 Tax=Paenibacillus haidiansis TaxID=1574488 RepID=A0ABU7VLT1_9BACL
MGMITMEHRLLDYFMAVAEELHFTKAADRLGITQPTLSHQIRLLEQEVGTPLFHRAGKKIHLTQSGTILMEHARRVIHELEQARLEIGELAGLQRGRLRIGCSGNHLMTEAMISFHRHYPGIVVNAVELATEETHDGLLGNKLDLGVVYLPLEDEQIESVPLFDDELILVVSRRHTFAGSASIRLEQLSGLPLVLFQPKFLVRQMIDSACKSIGLHLQPIMELSTMESQMQMVIQNVGGTVLPASYAKGLSHPDIAVIPLTDPTPRKTVGLVYRKNMFLDHTIQAFINHLVKI